ncbi:AmiS/UreI family transporter [Mycobacterium sp. NPDC003323]
MSNVGLLYVGAVLLLNGLSLLGIISLRAAAPMNLFVGALQCVIPTTLILQAGADSALLLQASGLYLFGFTYLYVGVAGLTGLDLRGLGWFSLFVAVAALSYAVVSAYVVRDLFSAVLWLSWALLWGLFFVLFALERTAVTAFTGWSTILLSQATCTVPALSLLAGFRPTPGATVTLAATVVVLVGVAAALSRRAPAPVGAGSHRQLAEVS